MLSTKIVEYQLYLRVRWGFTTRARGVGGRRAAERRVVACARVSSPDRKADPDRQMARLAHSRHCIAEYLTEFGSAMSAQGRGVVALEYTHMRDKVSGGVRGVV